MRAFNVRIFKCPRCNQKENFDLTDHEYDPSIPTYIDPVFRKFFAFVITLSIGLAISISVLGVYLPPSYEALMPLIFFLIAMFWLNLLLMKTSKMKLWKPA